ncbi:MAG TPA: hypothetical protein VLQ20_13820, partial [Planococcus sp. (in: firmicutes)]|nr:hypothetical protein [Planococcus sp. (in: firmicutes)]
MGQKDFAPLVCDEAHSAAGATVFAAREAAEAVIAVNLRNKSKPFRQLFVAKRVLIWMTVEMD